MDTALVCLDTETARLGGPPHLLEIGAVRIVDGEVQGHFESYVRPPVDIDPQATAIHGITEHDVRDAPMGAEVLAEFLDWLGDDWLAAHNAAFDARVLGFEFARAGLEAPGQPFVDSLRLARKLIPESPDHKLVTLAEFLELEEGDHHRALPDAVWCWKVIEACLERMPEGAGPATLVSRCGGVPVTIPGHAPSAGRGLKPRLRKLTLACERREEVTLLYGQPPEPPARLRVVPGILYRQSEKSYLEAECCTSGLLKTYRLDRVQRVL